MALVFCRESLEEQRLSAEINRKLGYHKARRDILAWARSRRRCIRYTCIVSGQREPSRYASYKR